MHVQDMLVYFKLLHEFCLLETAISWSHCHPRVAGNNCCRSHSSTIECRGTPCHGSLGTVMTWPGCRNGGGQNAAAKPLSELAGLVAWGHVSQHSRIIKPGSGRLMTTAYSTPRPWMGRAFSSPSATGPLSGTVFAGLRR